MILVTLKKQKGFILPFTMLITAIVLFVTSSSMALLSKQLYFSKVYKQSQVAYYAADDAMLCAVAIDDTYVGADGLGIFPHSTSTDPDVYIDGVLTYVNERRAINGLDTVDKDEISCAQSAVFNVSSSGFSVSSSTYYYETPSNGTEEGRTSTYNMRMNIGGGQSRCARITVNKTQSFRQIVAQGYAQCDSPTGTIERAVVNTTITE